jgi:uncharacterized protein
MRIGTAEPDSTFLTQGVALREVLENAGVVGPISILSTPAASTENASRLLAGEIDFGFMAANWIGCARAGTEPFQQPIDICTVAPMNAGPLYFIAMPDSDLTCVADMRGRRVAVGARASGMAQHAKSMFKTLGWKDGDVEQIYLDFAAGSQALLAGEVDAQLQCPLPNKVMSDLMARTAVRVLPWAADQLERLFSAAPVYRQTVMTNGMLRGLEFSLSQPAVLNVLVTRADADAKMVYDVACAIVAGTDELARLNALFAGLCDLFEPLRTWGPAALEFGDAPLHPGAIAAYRAKGLLPPAD